MLYVLWLTMSFPLIKDLLAGLEIPNDECFFQLVFELTRILDSGQSFSMKFLPLPRPFIYFGNLASGHISVAKIDYPTVYLPVRQVAGYYYVFGRQPSREPNCHKTDSNKWEQSRAASDGSVSLICTIAHLGWLSCTASCHSTRSSIFKDYTWSYRCS